MYHPMQRALIHSIRPRLPHYPHSHHQHPLSHYLTQPQYIECGTLTIPNITHHTPPNRIRLDPRPRLHLLLRHGQVGLRLDAQTGLAQEDFEGAGGGVGVEETMDG